MSDEVRVISPTGSTFIALSSRALSSKYTVVDAHDPDDTALDPLRCVGGGSYGIVVRARDELGLDRAIKLLNPDTNLDTSSEDFKREIALTNRQPFKHVVTIVDHGVATDKYGDEYKFYVSPYLDGETLDAFFARLFKWRDEICSSTVLRDHIHDYVLLLLRDILDGVGELERARVVHMDLKPTNILVYPRFTNIEDVAIASVVDDMTRPQGFIIDLGAGKSLVRDKSDDHRTKRIRSEYYFPEERNADLGYSDDQIDFQKLQAVGTEIDLFCSGRMFERLLLDRGRRKIPRPRLTSDKLAEDREKEKLWRSVFADDFDVLEGLIENLLSRPAEGGRKFAYPSYRSAAVARHAFASLPLKAARSVWSSEILSDNYPGTTIRVGQQLVHLGKPLDAVVDHPAFQRLKRINQLSLVSEIFPEATHTRFSHSLRTLHLAKRFMRSLARRPEFRLLFDRKAADLVLTAALLHDVGQYHFSHTIEDLQKAGAKRNISQLAAIPHDQNRAAAQLTVLDAERHSIASILADYGIPVDDVLYVIDKRPKGLERGATLNVTRDIVSGVIDVDRVSYLLHDSERTGVPFGSAVDVDSLVQALTIRWDPREGINSDSGLGIEENGVSGAEAILTAVYWMYKDVYWRHTNRAFMAAVKYVVARLLLSGAMTIFDYIDGTDGDSDFGALQYLHGRYDELLKRERRDGLNPLASVIAMNRLGFKRVVSMQRVTEDEEEVFARLQARPGPDTEATIVDEIVNSIPAGAHPKSGEILVDVPLKKRLGEEKDQDDTVMEAGTKGPVWVRTRTTPLKDFRDWVELREYSPLVRTLGPIEDHGRKIRVFFSTSLLKRLDRDDIERLDGKVRGAMLRVAKALVMDGNDDNGTETN